MHRRLEEQIRKARRRSTGDKLDLEHLLALVSARYRELERRATAHRSAEEALRENEERYRALVENAPEAILVYDVDADRFVDVNDNATRLFNLSRKRLLSIGPEGLSPAKQLDGMPSFGHVRGYIDRALDGAQPVFEWLHVDGDGREFPCEVRFSRLPSATRRLIRASVTSIAERKRNELLAFGENRVLEMIASGAGRDKTLKSLCLTANKLAAGMRSAVLLAAGENDGLEIAAAPALGGDLAAALERGAPNAAALAVVESGKPLILDDTAARAADDAAAAAYAEAGVAAAWHFPVELADDSVCGVFCAFLSDSRAPAADELDLLVSLVRLAGIAVKRSQDEEALRSSEARYRGLFENVVEGVYIAEPDGRIVSANPALVQMLGFGDEDELRNAMIRETVYVNPKDAERFGERLARQGEVRNFEARMQRRDGSELVVLENARAMTDEEGRLIAYEGTITDITERKIAETRVFEEKERAEVTLKSIGDAVITTDAEGLVDYLNPVAQTLTGWEARAARGRPIDEILNLVNEHSGAMVDNPVRLCLEQGRVIELAADSVLINRHGTRIAVQDSAAPIRDRVGNVIGAVMVFHDVSKEGRLSRQLSYQAAHDSLTGLINRSEFENRLIQALDQSRHDDAVTHALLYVDLDQFKVVNDTFGHRAGDELLRQIADVIQSRIRSTDVLARLGGDEFGVLLKGCSEERAVELAEEIRVGVEAYRFHWQESAQNVRCSVGVVMLERESQSVGDVMSAADVACYAAKDLGRNRVHLYEDGDASMRHKEMQWATRITRALDESRFEIYFQPIVSVGDGEGGSLLEADHYELLLRMRDENGELVLPDNFIPAAERFNLMPMLDRWVIDQALDTLVDTSDSEEAAYTIAVNLSGNSLSDDRFLQSLVEEIAGRRLPAGAVCFEITETAAIANLSRVTHFMDELKRLGCKFALDDFGTGLSSFTYLKNLPVDYLKIDGAFIQNVTGDRVDESFVEAINQVGHALGIQTVAERVESADVMSKLGDIGVELVQGYFVARPQSVANFDPWRRGKRLTA